jgi:hypothetical protein
MLTILLAIGILGAAVVLLSLRVLLVRDGEFPGTCASNNPYLRNRVGECWACGKGEGQECEFRDDGLRGRPRVLDRITGR